MKGQRLKVSGLVELRRFGEEQARQREGGRAGESWRELARAGSEERSKQR